MRGNLFLILLAASVAAQEESDVDGFKYAKNILHVQEEIEAYQAGIGEAQAAQELALQEDFFKSPLLFDETKTSLELATELMESDTTPVVTKDDRTRVAETNGLSLSGLRICSTTTSTQERVISGIQAIYSSLEDDGATDTYLEAHGDEGSDCWASRIANRDSISSWKFYFTQTYLQRVELTTLLAEGARVIGDWRSSDSDQDLTYTFDQLTDEPYMLYGFYSEEREDKGLNFGILVADRNRYLALEDDIKRFQASIVLKEEEIRSILLTNPVFSVQIATVEGAQAQVDEASAFLKIAEAILNSENSFTRNIVPGALPENLVKDDTSLIPTISQTAVPRVITACMNDAETFIKGVRVSYAEEIDDAAAAAEVTFTELSTHGTVSGNFCSSVNFASNERVESISVVYKAGEFVSKLAIVSRVSTDDQSLVKTYNLGSASQSSDQLTMPVVFKTDGTGDFYGFQSYEKNGSLSGLAIVTLDKINYASQLSLVGERRTTYLATDQVLQQAVLALDEAQELQKTVELSLRTVEKNESLIALASMTAQQKTYFEQAVVREEIAQNIVRANEISLSQAQLKESELSLNRLETQAENMQGWFTVYSDEYFSRIEETIGDSTVQTRVGNGLDDIITSDLEILSQLTEKHVPTSLKLCYKLSFAFSREYLTAVKLEYGIEGEDGTITDMIEGPNHGSSREGSSDTCEIFVLGSSAQINRIVYSYDIDGIFYLNIDLTSGEGFKIGAPVIERRTGLIENINEAPLYFFGFESIIREQIGLSALQIIRSKSPAYSTQTALVECIEEESEVQASAYASALKEQTTYLARSPELIKEDEIRMLAVYDLVILADSVARLLQVEPTGQVEAFRKEFNERIINEWTIDHEDDVEKEAHKNELLVAAICVGVVFLGVLAGFYFYESRKHRKALLVLQAQSKSSPIPPKTPQKVPDVQKVFDRKITYPPLRQPKVRTPLSRTHVVHAPVVEDTAEDVDQVDEMVEKMVEQQSMDQDKSDIKLVGSYYVKPEETTLTPTPQPYNRYSTQVPIAVQQQSNQLANGKIQNIYRSNRRKGNSNSQSQRSTNRFINRGTTNIYDQGYDQDAGGEFSISTYGQSADVQRLRQGNSDAKGNDIDYPIVDII